MLGSALLGDDYDSARRMPNPNGRAGLVSLLSSGSTCPIRVYFALIEQLPIAQVDPLRPARGGVSLDVERTHGRLFPRRKASADCEQVLLWAATPPAPKD